MWTTQEIKFKTLVKDQLVQVKLRPHSEKQSFIINWDLLSDKLAQNDERVVYQLKGASSRGLIDTIIYEGTDREVLLKNLIPYKNYTFEILAFYRGDKSNTIIDRKLVSFQTSSDGETNLKIFVEKSKFLEFFLFFSLKFLCLLTIHKYEYYLIIKVAERFRTLLKWNSIGQVHLCLTTSWTISS